MNNEMCNACGRPMSYCKGNCSKCKDLRFTEYCGKADGCFREKTPGCPLQAVIPTVTVDNMTNINELADCLVHVTDINTTLYIDDKHRPVVTWAGPVDIPGYNLRENPKNLRNQIVMDSASGMAAIFNEKGKAYIFGIEEGLNVEEAVAEVINKMAEDGTLAELVGEKLKPYIDAQDNITREMISELAADAEKHAIIFDTVADMKASPLLKAGGYAITAGFYSKGDNGGSLYKITDSSASPVDNIVVFKLDSGLFATFVPRNSELNVKQFGAKGNGNDNENAVFSKALSYFGNNSSKIVLNANETYKISNIMYIYSNTEIDMNGSKILADDNVTPSTSVNKLQFMNNVESMRHQGYGALVNFSIKNGTLDGNKMSGVMFCLFHADDCTFENLYMPNAFAATHVFDLGGCRRIKVKDCRFIGCLQSVESNNYREVIQPDYATYGALPYWGNDQSFAFDALPTEGLIIDRCTFKKNVGDKYFLNAIGTHSVTNNTPHKDIIVRNCDIYGCQFSMLRLPCVENVLIENNHFHGLSSTRTTDYYALNIHSSSGNTASPNKNIRVINNTYDAEVERDDLIFLSISGPNKEHLASDIEISGNIFNGKSISESVWAGKDFIHANNVEKIVVKNNTVRRGKHLVFKSGNTVLRHADIVNNICEDCTRYIRGNDSYETDMTELVNALNIADNYVRSPLGEIKSGQGQIVLGLAEDWTNTGDTTAKMPLVQKSGYPLYTTSNEFRIPNAVRNFRLRGSLHARSSNGNIGWAQIRVWDRVTQKFLEDTYTDFKAELADNAQKTFLLNDFELKDTLTFESFSAAAEWNDGRYIIQLRVHTTGDVVFDASRTKFVIDIL